MWVKSQFLSIKAAEAVKFPSTNSGANQGCPSLQEKHLTFNPKHSEWSSVWDFNRTKGISLTDSFWKYSYPLKKTHGQQHWFQSNIYIFLVKVEAVLTDQSRLKGGRGGEKTALPRNQVREKYYIFTPKATFWARGSVNYVTRVSHIGRHSKYTLFSIFNSFYPFYVNCYGRNIFSNTEINQNLVEKAIVGKTD